MEQARCWMLTKRKHSLTSHLQASTQSLFDQSSWEEQAFAEDAAGMLGGCIWPPRSYSCSFCRREFRSAQALGGHMNVHRRDRARLKQSPALPQNDHDNDNSPFQIPNTSSPLGFQYPNSHSQVCTLLYSPNPNSDLIIGQPSPSCSSKPSTNLDVNTFFPSFSSPTERDQEASPRSSPPYYRMGIDRESEGIGILENLELGCKNDRVSSDVGEKEEGNHCKRRRISTSSSAPFFVKLNSVDRHHVSPGVFEIGTCSKEELDLELRLGERPKVK